jgi:predicted phage baseplate assembly protein
MNANPLENLNDCGCCEGLTQETPFAIENRAGLSAIAYRVGTHSRFKATMLAQLSNADLGTLKGLMTREDDDFSIALIDAWACVADVLTFYRERIANEAYLRTATERNSTLQLGRLIGYRLRPGVAASAYLAFTFEDAPGAPKCATLPIGTKVQSVPGPGEQPQTFETIEQIDARSEWNAMKPLTTKPQPISPEMDVVLFKGTATKLTKGDALLIMDDADKKLRRVASVQEDHLKDQTTISLVSLPELKFPVFLPINFPAATFLQTKVPFNNTTIQEKVMNQSWKTADLEAFARAQDFSIDQIYQVVANQIQLSIAPAAAIFAMRKRAALFGYNAPDWKAMASSTQGLYPGGSNDWPVFPNNTGTKLYLDQLYKEIKVGDWVVVSLPSKTVIAAVNEVNETAAAYFAISGQVSAITLHTTEDLTLTNMEDLRATRVYIIPEALSPDDLPNTDPVQKNPIQLNGPVSRLVSGQTLLVSGTRADADGVIDAEVVVVSDVTLEGGYTTLRFLKDLANPYQRNTVKINGNVALATNGETKTEVLGGGDATQSYQQYTLKQPPLTYVSAGAASGAESTLEVYVNDVQWHEQPALYGTGARDRIFVTKLSDDGKTTVEFGDGRTGARLPTGRENITATYRKGIGTGGNLKAGQLTLLMSAPLGVKSVTNPQPATGGADSEKLEDARVNAPITVLTLDRIVSLSDYEDFARAFAGVAKALATWTWDGQNRGIFVTVAGPNGAPIAADSTTLTNLISAMHDAGDPYVRWTVQTYIALFFRLSALIDIDPDYQQDKVFAAVTDALRAAFSFDARAFGQGVALSEVIAVVQAVQGVIGVDVTKLYCVGDADVRNARLTAALPQARSDGTISSASLLTLDLAPIDLGVMS